MQLKFFLSDRNLSNFKFFYCRKHDFYGRCPNCILLNGCCDYQRVFDCESRSNFNPCPICSNKGSPLCSSCRI